MSRGFAISVPPSAQVSSARADISAREPLRHLIPLMDTFNHDDSASSSVHYAIAGSGKSEFVLTTHDDWEAGEEVFIHYGHFTPAEFLAGYGFVPTMGAVRRVDSCSNSASKIACSGDTEATWPQQDEQERHQAQRGLVATMIDIGGGDACGGASTCRKLKSSFLSALGSHTLELTAPHCLLHLANRSTLEAVIARSARAPEDKRRQELLARAAAEAIDAGESRDGDFEMFVLEMILKELQGREQMYGSTLEQDEQEQQERARHQQQRTAQGARSNVGRDGGLSIDALLSLLVAEKRLLRQCEGTVAEALMRAKLRKIGIQ